MREKLICGLYDVCFNLFSFIYLEMCIYLKIDNKMFFLMCDMGMVINIDISVENIVLLVNLGYVFFLYCYSCNYF